jgi:AraC-like DNA-binding protein/quercetin dioxygenase-like cupin family protein
MSKIVIYSINWIFFCHFYSRKEIPVAKREIEIVEYDRIEGLNMFMNTVDYRTPHQHDELELIWNLDGVLHVGSMGEDYVLDPGSILLVNREVIHEFRGEEGGATFLCMQLDLTRFRSSRSSGQILFDAFLPDRYLSGEEMTAVRKDILSLFSAYLKEEPDYGIYCASMAGLILYRLLRAMPHHEETLQEAGERIQKSQRMQRLLDYVDRGYMHKIRLSDFAEKEGRSMGYLSHLIRDTLNQSFQEYVTSVRLNAACQMIHEERGKLLDICYACGFSDYRYFVSAFRQRFSMTPEQYRNSPQAGRDRKRNHRSLHSLEHIYSHRESLSLLESGAVSPDL